MGTNCRTCWGESVSSKELMSAFRCCRYSSTGAGTPRYPTHSKAALVLRGSREVGHANVMLLKQQCRMNTRPAVKRVRQERTGKTNASPAASWANERRTHSKSCCWYFGSPSYNKEKLKLSSVAESMDFISIVGWLSVSQREGKPTTRHLNWSLQLSFKIS